MRIGATGIKNQFQTISEEKLIIKLRERLEWASVTFFYLARFRLERLNMLFTYWIRVVF